MTELNGLFSCTLPTLGRMISLDASSLENALEPSLESRADSVLDNEDAYVLLLVTDFFELDVEFVASELAGALLTAALLEAAD